MDRRHHTHRCWLWNHQPRWIQLALVTHSTERRVLHRPTTIRCDPSAFFRHSHQHPPDSSLYIFSWSYPPCKPFRRSRSSSFKLHRPLLQRLARSDGAAPYCQCTYSRSCRKSPLAYPGGPVLGYTSNTWQPGPFGSSQWQEYRLRLHPALHLRWYVRTLRLGLLC
jgi:hypothetical protein